MVRFMIASLPCRRRRRAYRCAGCRLQHQLLYAPRLDLGDDDLIRIAAIEHVNDLEPAQPFAGVAELPDDRPIELHLVDLTGDVPRAGRVAVRVRVRAEDVLMRTR